MEIIEQHRPKERRQRHDKIYVFIIIVVIVVSYFWRRGYLAGLISNKLFKSDLLGYLICAK